MFKKGQNEIYVMTVTSECEIVFAYINLSEKGNICKLIAYVNYIIMMNLLVLHNYIVLVGFKQNFIYENILH